MKITCTQKELARGIAIANRAVSPRSTMPIMAHLLLTATDNEIRISGTSIPMRIDCTVDCEVNQPGALAVPAKPFGDIISRLSGNVTLEVNHRTKSINILCGNYKARVNGLDAEDFPASPTDDSVMSTAIKTATLRQMIDQVAFAASTDWSRQTITGVEVAFAGELATMAATNGYRMGMRCGRLNSPLDAASTVIVPATSLHELAQALAAVDDEQLVTVQTYINRITFHAAGLDVSAQTIDTRFPDYHAIIPPSYATTVTVETKTLLRALQVARILTKTEKDGTERVELTVDTAEQQLGIAVSDAETGNSGDALDVEITGKPVVISLSIGYLLDVLSHADSEAVTLHLNDAHQPCIVKLVDGSDDFLHAIMPMMR